MAWYQNWGGFEVSSLQNIQRRHLKSSQLTHVVIQGFWIYHVFVAVLAFAACCHHQCPGNPGVLRVLIALTRSLWHRGCASNCWCWFGGGWVGGVGVVGRWGGKMFCRLRFLSWPLFLGYSLLRSWCYAVEVLLYALWRSWCYAVEFFCTLYDAFNATLPKFFCTLSNALDATP